MGTKDVEGGARRRLMKTGTWHAMNVRITFCTDVAAAWSDPCGVDRTYRWPRTDAGSPVMWTRDLKAFFKHACLTHPRTRSESRRIAAGGPTKCRSLIDAAVHLLPVEPGAKGEALVLHPPGGLCARYHRRVEYEDASEVMPTGTWVDVKVLWLEPDGWDVSLEAAIREWLTLGRVYGIMRWRDAGMGRFRWRKLAEVEEVGR